MTPDITPFKTELQKEGLLYLNIKVIPKSSKTELVDILIDKEGNQTLKIKLQAIPEKGKANIELIKYISKILDISKTRVTITSGKSNRNKVIKIIQNS